MSQIHVFKTSFLSFFLALILPIGNVWAARGSKRPGGSLDDPRYKKYRRLSPSSDGRDERSRRNRDDRMQNRGRNRGRDRRRDDRRDHRSRDRLPSEDRSRSYRLQRDEQRHPHAYPRQERRQDTSRRDDREYRTQRSPQASGYDAPRSLNSLFVQIKSDLQHRDLRLEKHLDALCEASYQRDFNFISVARAFNMLGRFAQNKPKRCDAIKAHRSFVPRMMQVAQQQMQGNLCEARGFVTLLYGCMRLSITPDKDWQQVFWTQSQNQLSDFHTQNYSNTLYAAANLSLTPPEDWQQAFWTESQHQLGRFNPQELSNTLYAAANLSLTPPEDWQQAFWTKSQLTLRRFNPQDFSNTLYAACVLDLTIPETVKSFVRPIVTSDREEDIRHLHAMYSAKDYLKAQGINLVFKENTLEKLRKSEDTRVSRLEKKTGIALAKVLQDMCPQIPLKKQHFIGATASTADFFIDACGDKGLVIQVDGPSHFLDNGTERQCVEGFTAFQTHQLKKQGYQVLRLPYDLLKKYGVYRIQNEQPSVPEALVAYLKEQLTPHLETMQHAT